MYWGFRSLNTHPINQTWILLCNHFTKQSLFQEGDAKQKWGFAIYYKEITLDGKGNNCCLTLCCRLSCLQTRNTEDEPSTPRPCSRQPACLRLLPCVAPAPLEVTGCNTCLHYLLDRRFVSLSPERSLACTLKTDFHTFHTRLQTNDMHHFLTWQQICLFITKE